MNSFAFVLLSLVAIATAAPGGWRCGRSPGWSLVGHDEGHLRDVGDNVALSHNQGGHTSSGNSGAHGVPFLSDSNLPVPAPPLLGGSKHPASAAHVAKGSLARPVGATSPHSWDPGHSATSAPRLGTCLMSSGLADTVGLPPVLGHLVVDHRHYVPLTLGIL